MLGLPTAQHLLKTVKLTLPWMEAVQAAMTTRNLEPD